MVDSKWTRENKKAEGFSASKHTIVIPNTRNGLDYMVPMGGVEPPRAYCTIDSESILSTNSNTSTGAEGGSRTRTVSPPPDFESGTSTNSITSAYKKVLRNHTTEALCWQCSRLRDRRSCKREEAPSLYARTAIANVPEMTYNGIKDCRNGHQDF